MTTIHSIIREALDSAIDELANADSYVRRGTLDTIATECETAIRALLTSDAAVERAAPYIYAAMQKLSDVGRQYAWTPGGNSDAQDNARRASRTALEAALAPERAG